jgi:hypothetical protein
MGVQNKFLKELRGTMIGHHQAKSRTLSLHLTLGLAINPALSWISLPRLTLNLIQRQSNQLSVPSFHPTHPASTVEFNPW